MGEQKEKFDAGMEAFVSPVSGTEGLCQVFEGVLWNGGLAVPLAVADDERSREGHEERHGDRVVGGERRVKLCHELNGGAHLDGYEGPRRVGRVEEHGAEQRTLAQAVFR